MTITPARKGQLLCISERLYHQVSMSSSSCVTCSLMLNSPGIISSWFYRKVHHNIVSAHIKYYMKYMTRQSFCLSLNSFNINWVLSRDMSILSTDWFTAINISFDKSTPDQTLALTEYFLFPTIWNLWVVLLGTYQEYGMSMGHSKNNEANVLQNGPKIIHLWYISTSFFLIRE